MAIQAAVELKKMTCLYMAERLVREMIPAASTDNVQIQLTRQQLVNIVSVAIRSGWDYKGNNEGAAQIETVEETRARLAKELADFKGVDN